ncbi:eukaryotic translation initiation factor 3 subunit K [Hyposmocoma kahamanoa]|uniref:eukaryotic translation initiation factor 3 subunit K n=1 Tax=Hyposmocoma kahamanoa TaxID=1477025 RepID=UPI000E6D963D|nr:eukaryotic translation initiation factor 3 subunit K [Hyposmocoma kahamanoa]
MAEPMKQTVAAILKSIERYNPANLQTLERYVEMQSRENTYDLEANLAVLKLYQFNPEKFNADITCQILLKALTNFPHTDFTLCKCLLLESVVENETISQIKYLADILEQCDFAQFWNRVHQMPELCNRINGFHDSIRKFVCHVVGITFQTIDKNNLANLLGGIDDVTLKHWVKKYGWRDEVNLIFIANQDENIKTKNITEKIEFDHLAPLMALL